MDTTWAMEQLRQIEAEFERYFVALLNEKLVGLPADVGVPLAQDALRRYNAMCLELAMKARRIFDDYDLH